MSSSDLRLEIISRLQAASNYLIDSVLELRASEMLIDQLNNGKYIRSDRSMAEQEAKQIIANINQLIKDVEEHHIHE